MDEFKNKSSRRFWTREETKAFLDAYSKRRSEFDSAKGKKHAMANVLEDLTALGVLTQPTTEEMLKVKLKNLIRAYKASSDTSKRTGGSLVKAPFEDELDEIFGTQPMIKNSHSLYLSGGEIAPVIEPVSTSSQPEQSKTPTTPAASTSSGRVGTKRKYWEMREKRAAEKNTILREYAANKIKKKEEAEQKKDARLEKKLNFLRELYKTQI